MARQKEKQKPGYIGLVMLGVAFVGLAIMKANHVKLDVDADLFAIWGITWGVVGLVAVWLEL